MACSLSGVHRDGALVPSLMSPKIAGAILDKVP